MMAGCESCGANQWYRKRDVVYEVNFGSGRIVRTGSTKERRLHCTLDVCVGCGRLTTYLQKPHEWMKTVGYDELIDTGTST